MYYRQFSPIGCLFWLIIFTWIFFALKLYYLIFALVIAAVCFNIYHRIKGYKEQQERISELNYEPKPGEVSKICPSCNKDVKRSATVCPFCGYKFD